MRKPPRAAPAPPEAARPSTKVKSTRGPRKKEPWTVSEQASDTEGFIGLNQQAAARRGNVLPGWGRMQMEAERELGIDISPLCKEFDSAKSFLLPRGVVHLWLEPVISHFTWHRCWRGSADEPVCGYARSLYVIGSALDHQRFEAWRRSPLWTLNDLRKQSQEAMARLVTEADALRDALHRERQAPIQQSGLLEELTKHYKLHQRYVSACDESLQEHAGAVHLLANRGDARPGLVFAEAELLAVPSLTPRRVSELIVDRLNKSDARKLVVGRESLPTFELRLTVVRPAEQ
jgi:hypothetical protein